MDPEFASQLIERALRSSGELLRKMHGRTAEATVKESIHSVVTEADLESERLILRILDEGAVPCNLITEESGYRNRNSPYTWVVDPLDGTSNFAANLPWFGVIIALLEDREPVAGGMYLPVGDQLYLACRGKGATRNGRQIRTTASSDLSRQLVAYSFDHHSDPGRTEQEMELMHRLSSRVRNLRSTNSLIDFCYMADGRLGAAINQTTKIWDIAAPSLMICEAGGRVTDLNGAELSFETGAESFDRNYGIMATGSALHEPLSALVRSVSSSGNPSETL